MERIAEVSPRFKARTAGVFWLLTILSATAANISALEALFRTGVAAALIATACWIAATLLVHAILKSVNRNVSLLAALFSLVGCASAAISFAFGLAPLVVLRGAQYLTLFTVEQLQALTLTSLRLSAPAGNISFAFFGLHCLMVGYLVIRSTLVQTVTPFMRGTTG